MRGNKIRAVFVTGTDTGVGKTVLTGLLARYLMEKGYDVISQKWIQTGGQGFPQDIGTHLRLMKRNRRHVEKDTSRIAPYVFRFPASPHLAASMENRRIYPGRIKRDFRSLSKRHDFVIVEGIGGALVPFSKKQFVIDIAKELRLPVLIVAQNKLGSINHTLLTVEAVRKRKIPILGIVFNSSRDRGNNIILKDNPCIIKSLTGERILGMLPWSQDKDALYRAFIPMGDRIVRCITR